MRHKEEKLEDVEHQSQKKKRNKKQKVQVLMPRNGEEFSQR
jgi:hypothetical protein